MDSNKKSSSNSCPFNKLNELFSRKWILYILRDLFIGKKYFNEFKKSNPEMSNASLSNNLKYLEKEGFIIKKIDDNETHTTEYSLTEKGKRLNNILYQMILFGLSELVDDVTDEESEEIKQEFHKILIEEIPK